MKTKLAAKPRPPRPDEIIASVKALARKRGVRSVPRRMLEAATGIRHRQVRQHFGSHSALLKACGLTPYQRQPAERDETLLKAMHKAFSAAGCLLQGKRFESACRYGRRAYRRRWGNWAAAVQAYQTWLKARHPQSPILRTLPAPRSPEVPWQGTGGARFGAPLLLPALQHAPTNEIGVVFLFGALAPALGYTVESIGTAFPDCAAKRRMPGPGEPWRRVRLEFEFKSRNFRSHRHDPKRCDVIVCWEHDWSDCPLEVVELKREVARLTKAGPVAV